MGIKKGVAAVNLLKRSWWFLALLALLMGCTPTEPAETTRPPTAQTQSELPSVSETVALKEGPLVVIDAGHQAKPNADMEPLGPDSTEMKAKVSSGTTGVTTGIREYELNLSVAKKLQQALEDRGYRVVMIRDHNDVDISNVQRAMTANALQADVFIRVHANSSTDPEMQGVLTICQTPENPYNADLYDKCSLLSQCVLDALARTTGAEKRHVWETDTMTGINWCQVPVTIVEMGYMSNATEDLMLSTEEYRWLMAQGMANGVDEYFEKLSGG